MKKPIPPSELILNPDGSVYHLNLRPEQIGTTIILVGDPDRVAQVSGHFDKLEHKVQKREFVTHTGWLGAKRLSVVSTGIGTDNIDIVMNELDALFNIDLSSRTERDQPVSLDFIRIGTSGILSSGLEMDEMLISTFGVGLDCLLPYYFPKQNKSEKALAEAFGRFAEQHGLPVKPSVAAASTSLLEAIGKGMHRGITLTCPGFYGPQGRSVRLRSKVKPAFFKMAGQFAHGPHRLTNFEMETSAIYGMARMLGHRAVSCNALVANRVTKAFSADPKKTVGRLIQQVLERIEGQE